MSLESKGIYNRYKFSDNYKNWLFRADYPSSSAEINEIQSNLLSEINAIREMQMGTGRIMRGGRCNFSPGSQEQSFINVLQGSIIGPGSYFKFSTVHNTYAVLYRVNGNGTVPTSIDGVDTILVVNILSSDTNNQVAEKTGMILQGKPDFTIEVYQNRVVIKNNDIGTVDPVTDGAQATNFSFSTVVKGSYIQAFFEDTLFYAEGYSNAVQAVELPFEPGENTTIGIAVLSEVIDESVDPTLLNPAKGTVNEGLPGAIRLKISARWTKEDGILPGEVYYQVHTLENGELVTPEVRSPEIETTKDLLSKYDEDANGNYVSEGFYVSYDRPVDTDDDSHYDSFSMNLSDGRAHIDGKIISYPYARKFNVPFVTGYETINNSPFSFHEDGWYSFDRAPIHTVYSILGTKLEIDSPISRGQGDIDLIPKGPVGAIIKVASHPAHQSSDPDYKEYKQGTDYEKSGSESIRWIGESPGTSNTYYVTYDRIDTQMNPPSSLIDKEESRIYLEGYKPNTVVYISYSYYLNRIDRVIMLSDGNIKVIEGTPAYYNPSPPKTALGLSLALLNIKHKEDVYTNYPEITPSRTRAYKMEDVQKLSERVEALQYSLARLAQVENISEKDIGVNKMNSFTDPFFDDDVRDNGIEQDALIVNKLLIPGYNLNQSTLSIGEHFITLDYKEDMFIDQYRFTGDRKINQYMWVAPPPLTVSVTPSPYSWVAQTIVKSIINNIIVGEERGKTWHPGWRYPDAHWFRTSSSETNITARNYAFDSRIYDVPAINLTVKAHKLNSFEKVRISIDGYDIATTYNADIHGTVTATFMRPAGLKSGSRLVRVTGLENNQTGTTTFVSNPLIETITQVTTNRQIRVLEDPVAEVFSLNEDKFLSSISLQFTSLPDEYVDVFILPTIVGYPDRDNGLAVKRIYRKDIELSKNSDNIANRTFVWNNFRLDVPLLLKSGVEYAIVASCTDPNCKVRYARIGEYELTFNKWQTTQPYAAGVFLTSSTGSTWTAEHTDDLTFQLKTANFSVNPIVNGAYEKTVNFGSINVTECTDIFLTTAIDVLPDTEVKYFATLVGRGTRHEIIPYSYFEIALDSGNNRYSGEVAIECVLRSKNPNYSPIISNVITLSWGTVILPSEYISKPFDISLNATHLKVNLDCYEPFIGNVTPMWWNKTTTGFTFKTETEGNPTTQQVSSIEFDFDYKRFRGGEYFRFYGPNLNEKYYIWFTKNGVGRNPASHNNVDLAGHTGIVVNILEGQLTGDTNEELRNKIIQAVLTGTNNKFNAASSGNKVTITSKVNGECLDIIDGEGWKCMDRLSNPTAIEYGFSDVQWASSKDENEKILGGNKFTRIKVVLDASIVDGKRLYDKRPSAANLRVYAYAI